MNQVQINHRQLSWLTASLLLTSSLVTLPSSIANAAGSNAVFSQIGPVLFALIICLFFYALNQHYPDKNLFEITFIVAGKWGGAILNAVILFFMWMRLLMELNAITGFINTTLLTRTPPEILTLMFVIILMYFGRSSVEAIARMNDFFFPVLFIGIFPIFLFILNEFHLERMEPFLVDGLAPIWKGNWVALAGYGEMFVMGAFLHALPKSKLFLVSIRHGVLLSAFGFTVSLLLGIGVLGSVISGRVMYPAYMVVEQIHITDFLDRLEILFFSIWFPAIAIKSVIIFLAILIAIASYTNNRDYRTYSIPLGWFVLATSTLSFQGALSVQDYSSFALPVIIPAVQVPLMVIIYGLVRWKKRKHVSLSEDEEQKTPGKIVRWGTYVYALLLVAILSIAVGVWFGYEYSLLGQIMALVFGLCMLIATIFSRLELVKLKEFTVTQKQDKN
ncbi:GerAB/ArcD/ProY family transporter [Ammoniphilus resinae]|uniref:Spore germination protein (Amino acid permease) n=1 Tax=Ammoniphilus resinae TaxID=861532 RepID=A0ABS4GV56_9BACL|nr:endospore germination permease [Ammoniphilus resinae]MBP1934153.1 spore germination protein (amino acid permease) [Ammoniphilus resinae]